MNLNGKKSWSGISDVSGTTISNNDLLKLIGRATIMQVKTYQ
jgi:hypothetical protein